MPGHDDDDDDYGFDDDDDYGFDDDDLDHLPANTLHHLEANALRATQHPAPASDYGLDNDDHDGAELVDLNDASGPPPASPWVVTAQAPLHSQPRLADDDDGAAAGAHGQHSDPHHLLQRITQVRYPLCTARVLP